MKTQMRWYIVSNYDEDTQKNFEQARTKLIEAGQEVQARWLTGAVPETPKERAVQNLTDITKSDGVLCFTAGDFLGGFEDSQAEFGVGLALNKRMVVIGPQNGMFHHLPNVEIYPKLDSFIEEGL